jgi:hypothetical protein
VVGPPDVEREAHTLRIRTRWDHVSLERLAEQIARHLASIGASPRG